MDDVEFVIKIILRARDEMARALAKARGELNAFGKDADRMRGKIDNLNNTITSLNRRMGGIDEKLRAWRTTLREAGRESDDTSDSIRHVGDAADDAGASTSKMAVANKDASEKSRALQLDLRKLHQDFRSGRRDRDDFLFGLQRIGNEFTKLANKANIGDEVAFDLNRLALRVKRTHEGLIQSEKEAAAQREQNAKAIAAAQQRAAKERADAERREAQEEKKLAEARAKEEQKRIADAIKARDKAREQTEKAREKEREEERKAAQQDLDRAKRARDLVASYDRLNRELSEGTLNYREQRAELQRYAKDFQALSGNFDRGSQEARQFAATADLIRDRIRGLDVSSRQNIDTQRSLADRLQAMGVRATSAGENVATLDNRLRGMIVLGVIAFAQQLNSLLVGMVGNLIAVAGSAVQAGGAIGGTFIAGLTQAIPVVALFVASMARVASVMEVVEQQEKVQQQTFQRAGQVERQRADRANALANANDRLREAQEGLTEAREEAQREIEDLILAERRAELAARGAALTQSEAQESLRLAIQRGGSLAELRRAQLGVEEAALGVDEAAIRRDRSRIDSTRAQAAGVEGADRVQQAQRQIVQANRALENARRSAQAAEEDMFAAATALQYMLSQLSPAERRLYEALRRLRNTFETDFRDVTDIMIFSVIRAVDRLEELLGSDRILNAASGLTTEISEQFDRLVDVFLGDEMVDQMLRISDQARSNLEPITNIVISLGRAWANIAEAAGPAFDRLLDFVGGLVDKFLLLTENQPALEAFFLTGERHLESWIELGLAVVELFAALFGAGSESGLRTIEDLTQRIREGTDYIRDNGEAVRDFFEDSRRVMYEVARVVFALGVAMVGAFDPGSVEAFGQLLTETVIPAIAITIDFVGEITEIISEFLALPIIGDIAKWGLAFLLFSKVITGVSGLIGGMIGQLGTFLKILGPLGRPVGWLAGLTGGFLGAQRAAGALMTTLGLMLARVRILGRQPFFAVGGRLADRGQRISGVAPVPATSTTSTRGATTTQTGVGGAQTRTTAVAPAIDGRRIGTQAGEQATQGFRQRFGVGLRRIGGSIARTAGPLAIGVGLINGIGSAFDDKASQLDFGDKVQEFLSGATFGIIPSAAEEQMEAYREALEEAAEPGPSRRPRQQEDPFARFRGGELDQLSDQQKDVAEGLDDLTGDVERFGRTGEGVYENLRRRVREFAQEHPEAIEFLDGLNDKLEDVSQTVRGVEIRSGDIIDRGEMREALRQIDALAKGGFISIGELRESMRSNIRDISEAFQEGSASWGNAMAENFGAGIRSVSRGIRDGQISVDEGMKEINRITRSQLRFVRDNMDNLSAEGKDRMAHNLGLTIDSIRNHWRRGGEITWEGLKKIRDLMVEQLKLYGVNESTARLQVERFQQARRGDLRGAATGGVIGRLGERGQDAIGAFLGRGEMVLNSFHQKYIDPAVQWFYGHPLGKTFDRLRGYHAGGPDSDGAPGFAGGYAGRSPAGYQTVGIPRQFTSGTPEFIARRVLGDAVSLLRQFRMIVTDAFATSGHRGRGHLHFGTAMDTVPGPGGSWDQVDQAVAYARRRGLTVLYNETPNHGRGHHAHFELQPGRISDAIAGALAEIPRMRVRGKGVTQEASQGALDMVREAANIRLREMTEVQPTDDPAHAPEGAISRAQAARIFRQAFEIALPYRQFRRMQPGWLGNLLSLAGEESSFRPGVSNTTPAGIAAGLPQGILQVTRGTFGQYALPGFTNPFNALHNAIASIRYQLARYGTIQAHAPYARGGEVDGSEGEPVPIVAHAKEWVLNQVQQSKLANMIGTTRNRLKQMLGFEGGPFEFQGGGEIIDVREWIPRERRLDRDDFPTARWTQLIGMLTTRALDEMIEDIDRRIKRARRGGVTQEERSDIKRWEKLRKEAEEAFTKLPVDMPITVGGVVNVADRLFDGMNRISRRSKDFFDDWIKRIEEFTKEGGLIEQLEIARQFAADRAERGLIFATHRLLRSGRVRRRGDPETFERREAEGQVDVAGENLENIREQERVIRRTQARVRANLRRARERGDDDAVKALTQQENRLREQFVNIRNAHAEALQTLFEAQVQAQQAAVDEISRRYERETNVNELAGRMYQALGNEEMVARINEAQRDILGRQAAELEGRISEARRAGATELADQLEEQVADLRVQVFESIQQDVEDAVERINTRTERRLGHLDLFNRMAEAVGTVGLASGVNVAGFNLSRAGVFEQRGIALEQQRQALQATFHAILVNPATQQNVGLIQRLTDQLADLDVTIAENTRAYFQARVEEVNNRAQFGLNVNDLNRQITELTAEIAGQPNQPGLLGIAQQRRGILETQRAGLQQLFEEAQRRGDQQAVNDLTIALLENQVALLENTKAVRELEGAVKGPQTFTTTAWDVFRQAIFNGMGGLLPQYQMGFPMAQNGARIMREGYLYGHAGETIRPAHLGGYEEPVSVDYGDVNITVNEGDHHIDEEYLARRVQWERSSRPTVRTR